MTVENGYDHIRRVDDKELGYTYIQSPLTAFIGDAFNYAAKSDLSFFFGGYVRTPLFTGGFTAADAFNMQSTGESAVDHSAGSSLIVCDLSGGQLAGVCLFDAMCSGTALDGTVLYGGAGTLHSAGMRYEYSIVDGRISCNVDAIEIYDAKTDAWTPLDMNKAYRCSFTFESTQNLVGFMPMLGQMLGHEGMLPFAPYSEQDGAYAPVPADNTTEEYYEFRAPYCQGVGVSEGTQYELKSWTALFYHAQSMGELDDYYTVENIVRTRIPATN